MRISKTTQVMSLLFVIGVLSVALPMKVFALKPGTDFSGMHFNLNVHGVPKEGDKPVPDDVVSGRKSIFIPLETTEPVTIEFAMSGDEWLVLDCDATGDGYASILLPRNVWVDDDDNPETPDVKKRVNSYNVYLTSVGKPGPYTMILDAGALYTDEYGQQFIDLGSFPVEGHKNGKIGGKGGGKPSWQNVTDLFIVDILTVWVDLDENGILEDWDDVNGNGVVDNEWDDANLNGVVDPGEWDDANGNMEVDNEWIDADLDGVMDDEVTTYENEWIFNILELDNYWWDVTNDGVRLMKLRFYPVLANGNGNGKG